MFYFGWVFLKGFSFSSGTRTGSDVYLSRNGEQHAKMLSMRWLLSWILLFSAPVHATESWWTFHESYHHPGGGDWYMGTDNSEAILAWGESYVMSGLTAMFRANPDPYWLDRLARHADAALALRDDVRGVTDYRGVTAACWQNTHYQPEDQAYCYVVHSGMIATPMAEFARLVSAEKLENELAYDGQTFGEKAAAYQSAAEAVVAAHDDQWNEAGYYIFRSDASFLTYAGVDLPLNQSNAMGRLLLVLYDLTGETEYRRKAEALGVRFKAQLTAYRWNYWGGSYSGNGEDVSHAAINVDFAAMLAARGLVFTYADMVGFSDTFMNHVYIDDGTFSDFVGGGPTNSSSYRPQVGRWLRLTPWRTSVYTAVRDLYETHYVATSSSASMLLSWGLLAEFELKHCEHFFYHVDWYDPDPGNEGDFRSATAYGGNILTRPVTLSKPCMIPLNVEMEQRITVGQWDGDQYHRLATWQPQTGRRFIPYEPKWPFVYYDGGVLFQFADPKFTGEGVRVQESVGLLAPSITSSPPTIGWIGEPVSYAATGEGDAPFWWSLATFPTGARVDRGTGVVSFVPTAPGTYAFTLALDNDAGRAEQPFEVVVEPEDTGGPDTGDSDTDVDDTGSKETGDTDEEEPKPEESSCGCRGGGQGWLLLFPPLWWIRRFSRTGECERLREHT